MQLNAACVGGTQQPTIESPLCGLILCASALGSSTSGPTKERLRFSGAPPSDRGTTTEHIQRKRRQCAGGCGGLQSHRRRERKKPHTGTQSSHLKFTDRAVSGGEQERLKMWHRALCVRLGKQRGDVPDKQRSPTLRSYLIRHQSFPLLPTRIQVNYLHLGRICSSARKWLFSAPSEDCPFWITWYYFVASFSGHTGYPLLCRPPDRFLRVRFAPHEPADTSVFNSTPCLFIYASAKPHGRGLCHALCLSDSDCELFCLHHRHTGPAGLVSRGPELRLSPQS